MMAFARDPNPGVNQENVANTSIIVHIIDYNDETPVIRVTSENPVSIPENAAVGTLVATVTATDRDVNPIFSAFE